MKRVRVVFLLSKRSGVTLCWILDRYNRVCFRTDAIFDDPLSMCDVKTNVRYKMKKTKGPNPLSNLKKKKRGGPDGLSAPDVSTPGGGKKKRKRR